ncbi:MAG TPA: hypothetical protein VGM13_06975 [Thermoanaerobaculia bacterium]
MSERDLGTDVPDDARAEQIRRTAFLVLAAVLAFRAVLLPVLAWNTRYVMDEFSQASFPRYIPLGFYDGFDPIKTVLSIYVFDAAHRLARNAVDLLHVARMEGVVLAFVVAAFTWGISRRLGRDRFQTWFSVAVLFSFTNFMERAFRIRSDSVAVSFAAGAAFVVLGGEGLAPAFLGGVLASGAFLCTQKAVYPLAAIGLALAASGVGIFPVRRQVARLGSYAGGVAATLLAYAAWFDLRNPFRVLSMVFLSPLKYAPLNANPHYVGIRGLYVTQTLARNPVPYALAAAGVVLVLLRFRSAAWRVRLAAVMAFAVALLVFRHDQPWPYVFVMALPFLAVIAPEALARLEERAPRRGPWIRLGVCALLMWQLPRNLAYLGHGNWVQNEVVAQAERLLAPEDRYFDGIGMIPTRGLAEAVSWEALVLEGVRAELARGDDRSIRRILESRPKVWILNYRIHALREFLPRLLDPSYVRVQPDLLLTGAFLPGAGSVTFVNRWPGRYGLFRPDGAPGGGAWTVDGHEAPRDGFLPAGRFEIGFPPSTGPGYLLPAGTTLPGPLPVTGPLSDLFGGVYD